MRYSQRGWLAVFGLLAALLPVQVQAADVDKYVPDDAQFVISVNVRQLVDSPLFKKLGAKPAEEQLKNNHEAERVLDLIGLNPLKDLDQVTITGPEAEKAQTDLLVIVHGDFNPIKIRQAADAFVASNPDTLKIEKVGETPVYVAQQDGKSTAFVALMDKHVLVVSASKARVAAALARHNGTSPSTLNPALRELARTVNRKQSIWVAALMTEGIKTRIKNARQRQPFLEKIDAVSGGLTITDEIKLDLDAHMATTEGAEQLTAMLRFAVPLAAGVAANRPEVKDYAPLINQVARAMHFNNVKKTASLELTISKALIQSISDAAQNAGSPSRVPPPPPEKDKP